MRKRAIFGIVAAVCIFAAGVSGIWVWRSALAQPQKAKPVSTLSYSIQRSEEEPASSHHVLSTAAARQATQLTPWGVALDTLHGFVWVAEPGCEPKPKCPSAIQGALGQYALSDGSSIANFSEPEGYSSPLEAATDKDGNIWFTQPVSDALGEFNPQTQSWHQWHLKKGSTPFSLIFDKQGNLWFTEFGTNSIGFFDPHAQKLVENSIPTPASNPYGITVDPQGTIWFSENAIGISQIGSFTPSRSGIIKIAEHAVGLLRPHLIVADRAGTIWYSGGFQGNIGSFDPRSGSSKGFPVYNGTCNPTSCTGTHISGINLDSKGNVWFTDSLSQRVGYLIPATGQVVDQTLPGSNAHPYDGLVIDSSDRVWFTEEFALMLTMWPAGTLK